MWVKPPFPVMLPTAQRPLATRIRSSTSIERWGGSHTNRLLEFAAPPRGDEKPVALGP